MKAVLLYEYGGPDKLTYEDVPDPVAKRESGACSGRGDQRKSYRLQDAKRRGEELVSARAACNSRKRRRRNCAGGGSRRHQFQAGRQGHGDSATKTYAEQTVVAANDLALVPEKLDLVKAAALPLVTLTGNS